MKTRAILLLLSSFGFLGIAPCFAGTPEIVRSTLFTQFDGIVIIAYSPSGAMIGVGNDDIDYAVFRASDLAPMYDDDDSYGFANTGLPSSIAISDNDARVAFASSRAGSFGSKAGLMSIPMNGSGYIDLTAGTVVAFSPTTGCTNWVVTARTEGIRRCRIVGPAGGTFVDFPNSTQNGIATTLVFENCATFLVGTDQGNVQRWQVNPPLLLWQTNFPDNRVAGINLLADGRKIITLSSNLSTYQRYKYWSDLRMWEIGQTNFLMHLQPDYPFFSSTLTPDGKYLFTPLKTWDDNDYDTNHVALWRVSDGREMVRYDEDLNGVEQVAVSPDRKTFAYGRSDGMVFIARMPLLFDEITRAGNQTILHWQGGSGLYQLQSSTNLASGSWENIGSATTNQLATNLNSSTLFFRVQSLSNP